MHDLGKYRKKTHVQIQARYFSFVIAGSIALVGLVFALGVLVGSRQASSATNCPVPDALALLDYQVREPVPPSQRKSPKLSFHESLLAKRNNVPTPASLMDSAEGKAGNSSDKSSGVAEPAALPLVQPQRDETPVPELASRDEKGIYSLQVGSFQNRQEATQMVHQLERAGHEVFVVRVNMPERGGVWYRVRVGPFTSEKEAWQYKKQFEDQERIPAFVVKRKFTG
jgi:cell division septation protein DedD